MQQDEGQFLALLGAGHLDEAATEALRLYGGEIFGFIVSRVQREQYADDVYSLFTEDLWRGLSGYARKASLRAWLYALARNACHRYLDRELRPARARDTERSPSQLQLEANEARSSTALHLRTTGKQRGQSLRERLSEQDRDLLTLRVDRQLDWREVAEALGAGPAELDRAAARHRKRFQLIKAQLRDWAEREGWLSGESAGTGLPPKR